MSNFSFYLNKFISFSIVLLSLIYSFFRIFAQMFSKTYVSGFVQCGARLSVGIQTCCINCYSKVCVWIISEKLIIIFVILLFLMFKVLFSLTCMVLENYFSKQSKVIGSSFRGNFSWQKTNFEIIVWKKDKNVFVLVFNSKSW